ncbi:MAG: hypothetical protein GC180_12975 [Bacteroidetes bacterium]|nr:hypothetical protein [Bacteroidota bacterium]
MDNFLSLTMSLNKLPAYFKQRFPIVVMVLFLILTLTVFRVSDQERDIVFQWGSGQWIFSALACISFFFRLRVMDEIKDFKIDREVHSERLVVRGEVKISELMLFALPGALFELYWSYQNSLFTAILWLICLGFSLLMRYEFFVKSWLEPRLFIYALSHTLIMPLVVMWLWGLSGGELHSAGLWILASIAFFAAFAFEMARKSFTPHKEPKRIPTYTKLMGEKGAITGILALLWLNVLGSILLFHRYSLPVFLDLVTMLAFGIAALVYMIPFQKQEMIPFRRGENAVSLVMLVNYLLLILML